ncbi:MAG: hypothetical protein U0V72_04945 [Cytophagales bacterium]
MYNPDITSLSQLEWRIKGMKLSKDKMLEYLSSTEGKEALKKISAEKANKMLGRIDLDNDFPDDIANAFIDFFKKDTNFNLIFK